MKTKILRMSIVVLFAFGYNGCNPAVPSAGGSQIGLIGEAFRSSRTVTTSSTSTTTETVPGTSTNNGVAVTYANAAYIFTIKIAATSITPIVTQGTPTAYSITPSLPAGLNLDTTTGVISGTPTSILIPTNHTLTATGANNTSGTYTFKLTIYGTQLTKTGQTACYNTAGGVIGCTGTGQDGEYRKGIDASFTGPTLSAYANEYTTTDNNTGLVWASCSWGLLGSGCGSGTIEDNSWSGAISNCSSLMNSTNSGNGYAGIKTWRLPTMTELFTLINFGSQNPAIYTANFPNSSNIYWSSDTAANDGSKAWKANFFGSGADAGITTQGADTKSIVTKYRCVSGSMTPKTYVDNGDQTILDITTGLTWTKCLLGKSGNDCSSGTANAYTWTTLFSSTSCSGLTLEGKSWRVPNAKEIASIADYSSYAPTHNQTYFPGDYYITMTSTTRPSSPASSEVFWGTTGSFYGTWTGTPSFNKTGLDQYGSSYAPPTRCVTGP